MMQFDPFIKRWRLTMTNGETVEFQRGWLFVIIDDRTQRIEFDGSEIWRLEKSSQTHLPRLRMITENEVRP